jgi:UDP-N-acetylglucosamine:LPS N-acetylglucosamine transferase
MSLANYNSELQKLYNIYYIHSKKVLSEKYLELFLCPKISFFTIKIYMKVYLYIKQLNLMLIIGKEWFYSI